MYLVVDRLAYVCKCNSPNIHVLHHHSAHGKLPNMSGIRDTVEQDVLKSWQPRDILLKEQVLPTRRGSRFWASSNEGAQNWAPVSLAMAHPCCLWGPISGLLPLRPGQNQAPTAIDQGYRLLCSGSAPALLRLLAHSATAEDAYSSVKGVQFWAPLIESLCSIQFISELCSIMIHLTHRNGSDSGIL
jgi:hypothetical protein